MLHYFLEVSIAWFIFYCIYFLFLRKETFFSSNRWYLIHTIILGLLIPLIRKIPFTNHPIVLESKPLEYLSETSIIITQVVESQSTESFWNLSNILILIYSIGVFICLTRMAYGLKRIFNYWKEGEKKTCKNYVLVSGQKNQMPFSFLKWVFINENHLNDPAINEILEHELLHVKSKHTYDILFLESLSAFFWWNPMIYLYKRSIKETHEYMADAYALKASDKKNYGQILLGHSSSGIELALTHQFFNSHLKKRIDMMYKEKSALYKWGKYLLVIPMVMFMAILFSSNKAIENQDPPQELVEKLNELTAPEKMKTFFINIGMTQDEKIKFPNEKTEQFMHGVSLLQQYGDLVKKFPEFQNYITESIEEAGIEIGKQIIISPNDEGKYCLSSSPIIHESALVENYKDVKRTEDTSKLDLDSKAKTYPPNIYDFIDATDPSTTPLVFIDGKEVGLPLRDHYKGDSRHYIKAISKEESIEKFGERGKNGAWTITTFLDFQEEKKEGREYTLEDGTKRKVTSTLKPMKSVEDRDYEYTKPEEVNASKISVNGKEPLIYLNGEEVDQTEMERLDPQNIKSIKVLKGDSAVEKYGERAREGVVEITATHSDRRTSDDGKIVNSTDEIFKVVEEMPRFPGCEDMGGTASEISKCSKKAMLEYIYNSVRYPKEARESGIEGMTVVQFVVEPDGSIGDINLLRDIGGGCGEATKGVIEKMAEEKVWRPGYQRGKAVRVLYTLPIKFKIDENKEYESTEEKIDATVENIKLINPELKIIGNPVQNGILNFDYKSFCNKEVVFTITDVMNNVVTKIILEPFTKTRHQIHIEELTAGAYFLTVNENGILSTEKFIVQ